MRALSTRIYVEGLENKYEIIIENSASSNELASLFISLVIGNILFKRSSIAHFMIASAHFILTLVDNVDDVSFANTT